MSEKKCCQEMLVLISDFLDGDLPESECTRLESHLATCENCRTMVGTMEKTISLYRDVSDIECLPEDVKQRLFKCLDLEDLLP